MVNGTHQEVAFSTVPEGSAVKVFGGPECVTPCKLKLQRKRSLRVDFAQTGYKPAYLLMRSKLGGATFGNVLAGGIIGVVVDASNGSNSFLSPDPVKLKLAAQGTADEPMLIDKKGETSLLAHNDSVRVEVAHSIGNDAAGLVLTAPTAPPAAPATTPAPALVAPAPAPDAPPPPAN